MEGTADRPYRKGRAPLAAKPLTSVLGLVGTGLAAGFYEVLKSRAVHDVEIVAFSTNEPARVELVQGVGDELSRRADRTRQFSDRREWLDDPQGRNRRILFGPLKQFQIDPARCRDAAHLDDLSVTLAHDPGQPLKQREGDLAVALQKLDE